MYDRPLFVSTTGLGCRSRTVSDSRVLSKLSDLKKKTQSNVCVRFKKKEISQ